MNTCYKKLVILVDAYEKQVGDGAGTKFLTWVLDTYKPEGFEIKTED